MPVPAEGRSVGKSADGIPEVGGAVRRTDLKRVQEKPRSEVLEVTVPETDTGRRGEYPQARERTLVKELGKLAP